MADGENINGMKAQDWKVLNTSNLDSAASKSNNLSAKQQRLFDSIVNVVKAAAIDIHGTSADDKYKYIVDLIMRRSSSLISNDSKDILDELKTALQNDNQQQLDNLEDNVQRIIKKLNDSDAAKVNQSIDSVISSSIFSDDQTKKFAQKIIDYANEQSERRINQQKDTTEKELKKLFTQYQSNIAKIATQQVVSSPKVESKKQQKPISTTVQKTVGKIQLLNKFTNKIALSQKASGLSKQVSKKSNVTGNLTKLLKNVSNSTDKVADYQLKLQGDESSGSLGIFENKQKAKKTESKTKKFFSRFFLNPIMGAFTAVGKAIWKVTKRISGSVGKGILAFIKTPGGAYALGFIVGYIWTRWLKKYWDIISKFIEDLRAKDIWFLVRMGLRSYLFWKFFRLGGLFKRCSWLVERIGSILKSVGKGLWKGIKGGIKGVIKGLGKIGSFVWKGIKGSITWIGKQLGKVGNFIWDGIKGAKDVVTNIINGIKSTVSASWNWAKGFLGFGENAVKGANSIVEGGKALKDTTQKIKQTKDTTQKIKQTKDTAQKLKQTKDTAQKLKQTKDTAQKLKQTKDVVQKTNNIANAGKTGKTLKNAGRGLKAGKIGARALKVFGAAAGFALTAWLNKMELEALIAGGKAFAEQNGCKSLDEVLNKYDFVDEDGNDITPDIHFDANNIAREIEFKIDQNRADLAAEALNLIVPGAGLAVQYANQKLFDALNEGMKARDECTLIANKSSKDIINRMKKRAEEAKKAKAALDAIKNKEEKQKLLKEKYDKLVKVKAAYRSMEDKKKQAEKLWEKENSKWFSSREVLTSLQNTINNYDHMKMKLLEDNGLTTRDMRTYMGGNLLTGEQEVIKEIAENELEATGTLSDDTYQKYIKAFYIEGGSNTMLRQAQNGHLLNATAENKSKIISEKFGEIKKKYDAAHPAQNVQTAQIKQGVEKQLQNKSAAQQNTTAQINNSQQQLVENINEGNSKIVEELKKSIANQNDANEEIIDRIKAIDYAVTRKSPSNTTNVIQVSTPSKNNNALMENNSRQKIM